MRRDLNSAGWFEAEGGAKEGKCNWEPRKSQRGSELLSMFLKFQLDILPRRIESCLRNIFSLFLSSESAPAVSQN